ncbi:CDP-diacylglycerol--glycerol-3-phosphate 3-phosphatidyltransferase [Geitlerinema sp. PCC 7407]|uniref:CDP-diacylglycerol--glycerol-3-phosphate 3-phosphatidyltransferase n=1 Tax=Geitlerinema sp. PCC 7407 TaxID=1173025 RepID=UPI00029F9BE2|nr:CDP-diacylglycerol--glycerol-3-phosphate 3-phosphatidyltransferase [Geitlerinema sp. PCC 7407]AFY65017.1 CDP-diacylglycerol--glycerol-3-phosphate 3-phosphatidyltransferase [Geitlerinema sp. PCC 7407]
MNLPPWITVSRLIAVPLLLLWLRGEPSEAIRWVGCGVFVLAAGTDWLDGYLARRLNQVTDLGKFLDPLVDKLLVLAPLMALIGLGQVPAWGVFIILARELTIAGWRVNPLLFTGSSSISGANLWGKLKTVSQIVAIALLIAPLPTWQPVAIAAFWLSVVLTVISGVIYIWPSAKSTSATS